VSIFSYREACPHTQGLLWKVPVSAADLHTKPAGFERIDAEELHLSRLSADCLPVEPADEHLHTIVQTPPIVGAYKLLVLDIRLLIVILTVDIAFHFIG
jgi:hypothetical protein